ncbi:MAG TPA: peptidoglycan editing factor PgeF [Chloroflexia bacterium]|nr:peptidoglycan editing factor PgeF [Chloroflexia bacterium]
MAVNSDNSLALPLFQFETLRKHHGLVHAVATRLAPANPLLPHVQPARQDDYRTAGKGSYNPREIIHGRRSEMLAALGVDYKVVQPNLVGVQQKHTANVAVIGDEAYGAELNWDKPIPDADGLVTNRPNIPLMTIHADCPAILLYDPVRHATGALHSGWRGTVAKIAFEGVRQMVEQFGSDPADILAGVGPSIGPCCYQVGEPVLSEVERAFGPAKARELLPVQADGSHHFDLWQAIHLTLLEAGLRPEHIEQSNVCTRCHNDRFFSYRCTPPEERHNYGQFTALVMLQPG